MSATSVKSQTTNRKAPESRAQGLEEVYARLKGSGLRATDCRKAILATLVENHGPFTTEELYALVPRRLCDRATVFRCVASLQKAGLLRRCDFGDGIARFEINDPGVHHHHHLVCTACKKIEIVDDCDLLGEIDRFAHKRGYTDVSHSLEFFGTCPKCK